MSGTSSFAKKNNRLLVYFILAWLMLNIIQACLVGLDGDETYYWIYSLGLQWGYFDHPPMVALSIKLGEMFGHGYLFTRLGTILLSAGTVYFGFKALPDHLQNTRWYVLIFASVLLFHVYGFITTPDAPLLFFTSLFFYAYKQYLRNERFVNVLFLAASIAGMIYSKYHGVLPVFFVFLSNPKLIFKRSAWLVVALVTAAFLPHLWWQQAHDWPTVRYHIFERNRGPYKIEKTTNYILGQLLVFGPFTTAVAIFVFLKRKITGDIYFRSHVFSFFGVLIFFLLSSAKKNVEPHWTLIAGIPFVVLFLSLLERATDKFRKWLFWLAVANIVLLLVARIIIAVPGSPAKNIARFQVQIFSKAWADSIYKQAKGTPVVFIDNYSSASLYKYYHPGELSTCFSSVYYRKSNYNLQNLEPFNNKTVYTLRRNRITENDIEIKNNYDPAFLHKVDSFKAIVGLQIRWLNQKEKVLGGENMNVVLELSNPLSYPVTANNLFLNFTFFKSKRDYKTSPNIPLKEKELEPGFKKTYQLQTIFPPQPGKYRLIFSFDQPFIGPAFSSPFYEIEVK